MPPPALLDPGSGRGPRPLRRGHPGTDPCWRSPGRSAGRDRPISYPDSVPRGVPTEVVKRTKLSDALLIRQNGSRRQTTRNGCLYVALGAWTKPEEAEATAFGVRAAGGAGSGDSGAPPPKGLRLG
jgi:hypothetical protein